MFYLKLAQKYSNSINFTTLSSSSLRYLETNKPDAALKISGDPGKKNAFSTLDFGNAFAKLQIQKKNCGFCKCIFMNFANAFHGFCKWIFNF